MKRPAQDPGAEQPCDHHDGADIDLMLIGMPGIEKRLARFPQLYSQLVLGEHVSGRHRRPFPFRANLDGEHLTGSGAHAQLKPDNLPRLTSPSAKRCFSLELRRPL
jgi:hypothetical protein